MQKCSRCGVTKSLNSFYLRFRSKSGVTSSCKVCQKEIGRVWRNKHRDRLQKRSRITRLKRLFGITVEVYDRMLEEQGGICYICKKVCSSGRRLAVDHCHKTKLVRGLLCGLCNRNLGWFEPYRENILNYTKTRKRIVKGM